MNQGGLISEGIFLKKYAKSLSSTFQPKVKKLTSSWYIFWGLDQSENMYLLRLGHLYNDPYEKYFGMVRYTIFPSVQ